MCINYISYVLLMYLEFNFIFDIQTTVGTDHPDKKGPPYCISAIYFSITYYVQNHVLKNFVSLVPIELLLFQLHSKI